MAKSAASSSTVLKSLQCRLCLQETFHGAQKLLYTPAYTNLTNTEKKCSLDLPFTAEILVSQEAEVHARVWAAYVELATALTRAELVELPPGTLYRHASSSVLLCGSLHAHVHRWGPVLDFVCICKSG